MGPAGGVALQEGREACWSPKKNSLRGCPAAWEKPEGLLRGPVRLCPGDGEEAGGERGRRSRSQPCSPCAQPPSWHHHHLPTPGRQTKGGGVEEKQPGELTGPPQHPGVQLCNRSRAELHPPNPPLPPAPSRSRSSSPPALCLQRGGSPSSPPTHPASCIPGPPLPKNSSLPSSSRPLSPLPRQEGGWQGRSEPSGTLLATKGPLFGAVQQGRKLLAAHKHPRLLFKVRWGSGPPGAQPQFWCWEPRGHPQPQAPTSWGGHRSYQGLGRGKKCLQMPPWLGFWVFWWLPARYPRDLSQEEDRSPEKTQKGPGARRCRSQHPAG